MFLLSFCAVLLASLVAGLTGFGFAIVAVPLLLLVMPPKMAVPLTQLLSVALQAMILVEARKSIALRRVWPLLVAGMAGVPLGTYLLLLLDSQTMRILVGVVVVVSTLVMLAGWRLKVRNERLALVPIGLTGGALGGSTGMPGPPVILFFANQSMEKQTFRANLVLYFLCTSLIAVVSAAVGGLMITKIVLNWLGLLPALLVGMGVGVWLARRINQERFQKITLIVLALSGLVAIALGLELF